MSLPSLGNIDLMSSLFVHAKHTKFKDLVIRKIIRWWLFSLLVLMLYSQVNTAVVLSGSKIHNSCVCFGSAGTGGTCKVRDFSFSNSWALDIDQWSFRVLCKYIISNELQFLGAFEYSMTLNSCGYVTLVTRGSLWWAVLGFAKNSHDLWVNDHFLDCLTLNGMFVM